MTKIAEFIKVLSMCCFTSFVFFAGLLSTEVRSHTKRIGFESVIIHFSFSVNLL